MCNFSAFSNFLSGSSPIKSIVNKNSETAKPTIRHKTNKDSPFFSFATTSATLYLPQAIGVTTETIATNKEKIPNTSGLYNLVMNGDVITNMI